MTLSFWCSLFSEMKFPNPKEDDANILSGFLVHIYVDELLRRGVNFNWRQNALAICAAVNTYQREIVVALIKAGIDVNPYFTCIRRLTPLKSAQWRGYTDIVKILKQAGAK